MKNRKILLGLIILLITSCTHNIEKTRDIPLDISEFYYKVRNLTGASNEQVKIEISVFGDKGYRNSKTIANLKEESQINNSIISFDGIPLGETITINIKIFVKERLKYSAQDTVKIDSEKIDVIFNFVLVEHEVQQVIEENEPGYLTIELLKNEALSNTTKTIIIKTSSPNEITQIKWQKDGSVDAKELLVSEHAMAPNSVSQNEWSFEISDNGTYTVAAEDAIGRRETAQIVINEFDRIGPNKVSNVIKTPQMLGNSDTSITLNWTDPEDGEGEFNSPFDHIVISIFAGKNESRTQVGDSITLNKGTEEFILSNVDKENDYYEFEIVSVDLLGNESNIMISRYRINYGDMTDFVFVEGTTINSKIGNSKLFINGRNLEIKDFYICDHEVTQGEYEKYCSYPDELPSETSGKGENYPAGYMNWYAALAYCNLRSMDENLQPCYSIVVNGIAETDPSKWGTIPNKSNNAWTNASCDFEAEGYRLPTEVEWEYAALGGKNGINGTLTKYVGSDTLDEVAWCQDNTTTAQEIKKKEPNSLFIYDMSGNVAEYCWDSPSPGNYISTSLPITGTTATDSTLRVLRGGAWNLNISQCELFDRGSGSLYTPYNRFGFRVVRSVR